jgi:biotin synthase-like enzyme
MTITSEFELGPIRPPSEAGSLLIRVTRNCPWNRCTFCGTYRGRKFSRRGLDEVKADIDTAKAISEDIKEMSRKLGDAGQLTRRVLTHVLRDASVPDSYRSVAYWMACGGETVFLQDANSLILSTDVLVSVLGHLRATFPEVKRVTSYARAVTLKTKSVEDFVRLRDAGLSRLHVGMESGSDLILKAINKGARADQMIEGGKRVVQAGISLCLYVIPGIGGSELSEENAIESARVINAINPHHVRLRSLFVRRGTELADMMAQGTFQPPDEDTMVREIRMMVEHFDGIMSTLVSDHILNLLEEVEGTFPQDKQRILDVIDRYLNLPEEDRLLFQLGRRGGALRSVAELDDPKVKTRLSEAKRQIEHEMPGGVPQYILALKRQFV